MSRFASCRGVLSAARPKSSRARQAEIAWWCGHALGQGRICSVLLPWFGSGESPLAKLSLCLADDVIRPVQPVLVDGLPVEWLSTRSNDHCSVVVANHDGQPWRGTVTVQNVPADFLQCRELLTGTR